MLLIPSKSGKLFEDISIISSDIESENMLEKICVFNIFQLYLMFIRDSRASSPQLFIIMSAFQFFSLFTRSN